MTLYPLLFEQNRKTLVWGMEDWTVSAVPGSESIVANGQYAGKSLSEVISMNPVAVLGAEVAAKSPQMPLLTKIIDARQDLSIQVHPNDEMARREHNKLGKSEMWYIMDAEPGAYLYAGFSKEITPLEYAGLVESGHIVEALAKHPVKRGDVFYLPAGRVHAICGGIRLAEVQQSSDVTYRIFDYNRPGLDGKPRQLHTELAAQALDYTVYSQYKTLHNETPDKLDKVLDTPNFSIRILDINEPFHRNLLKYSSFFIVMNLGGACRIRVRSTGEMVFLPEYASLLIPAAIADYDIEPAPRVKVLEAFINNRKGIMDMISDFLHIG